MKMGMSRTEAKARVADGEYTWDDLRRLLEITHPILEGEAGMVRSRVNAALSLAISFNIHWRASRGRTGPILSSGDQLSAVNLIRDFGTSRGPRQRKTDPPVHHQELINIHDDDPPRLFYWTRNDAKRRWESKDGDWCVYDQWTCGRITMCRRDKKIAADDPAWNEIYAFAKSQTGGSITDGRQ